MGNHGESWEIMGDSGNGWLSSFTRFNSLPTPIHKGIPKGWRPPKAARLFVEAARSAASFMDGCGEAVEAAEAAEAAKT